MAPSFRFTVTPPSPVLPLRLAAHPRSRDPSPSPQPPSPRHYPTSPLSPRRTLPQLPFDHTATTTAAASPHHTVVTIDHPTSKYHHPPPSSASTFPPARPTRVLALARSLAAAALLALLLHATAAALLSPPPSSSLSPSPQQSAPICPPPIAAAWTPTSAPPPAPAPPTAPSERDDADDDATGPWLYPAASHFRACGATLAAPAAVGGGGGWWWGWRGVGLVLGGVGSSVAPAAAAAPKFFHEAPWDGHLDARYVPGGSNANESWLSRQFRKLLQPPPSRDAAAAATAAAAAALPTTLRDLLASFSRLADSTSSPWWIAHGTLLGWWWGGAVLPWDDDVDVQMTLSDLVLLASRRNGTVWEGRYLFEVNPSVLVRYHERENTLDARFIDTVTGRMVDVTALAGDGGRGDEGEEEGGGGREAVPAVVACKSPHRYATREMFPLRRSVFEGVDVWVPYDARAVLVAEYGVASVARTVYRGFAYNATARRWEPLAERKLLPGLLPLPR